jgi:hypothetical protein
MTINSSVPRQKIMNRQSRLQSAKHWLPTFKGNNIKGQKTWFGVHWPSVIQELKILGIKLDNQYVNQVLQTHENKITSRYKKINGKIKKLQENH